jgi:hypothetical protein
MNLTLILTTLYTGIHRLDIPRKVSHWDHLIAPFYDGMMTR